MRFIQAFFAWGNIEEIEEMHREATELARPDNMLPKLRSI